jgi:predicted nucleotidyltransferase
LPYEWKLGGAKLVRPAKLYSPENYEHTIQTFNNNYPNYLVYDSNLKRKIIAIPRSSIDSIFEPSVSLALLLEKEKKGLLDDLETAATKVVKSISKPTRVAMSSLGVHGSISLGMHNPQSDIDIAVYGATNFSKVLAHLHQMCNATHDFSFLEETIFDTLRRNRFLWHDRRVVVNAIREYKEIRERFGDFIYQATRRHISSKCVVTDDWESVFRPAVYAVSQHRILSEDPQSEGEMKPDQVVSMIGEFRGVASKGEEVKVSGSLERVIEARTSKVVRYRIVVGSGEKKPQDEFIWPSSRTLP